ncbi:MAG: HD-GYP domain-containing protein [Clostridium sp.]
MLNSLKIGLEVNSGETEQHTNRVLINAIKIGERLNLSLSQLDELKIAAEFHDIGKIGISQDILHKPGALTRDEYEIMKTHTEKGYRIIKASSELKSVAESVLYHHEKWDGTGYPIGLKGSGIPLLARIISVCDAYDVMTNDRVYKKAMSKEAAILELKRCSGTQFDPEIVKVFIENLVE